VKAQIITGDCVEVMKGMAENSVDAIKPGCDDLMWSLPRTFVVEQSEKYIAIARDRGAHAVCDMTGKGRQDSTDGSPSLLTQSSETAECGEQGCLIL